VYSASQARRARNSLPGLTPACPALARPRWECSRSEIPTCPDPVGTQSESGCLRTMLVRQVILPTPSNPPILGGHFLANTSAHKPLPTSVANKRLTVWLCPLDATYKKHRVGVGSDFPRHSTFNADSHLPYTLPSSVSGNSFVCHSYENCRVSPTISFPCGTRRNTDPLGTICPSGYTVPPPSAFNTGQCLVSPTIRLLASPLFDRLPPSDSSQR